MKRTFDHEKNITASNQSPSYNPTSPSHSPFEFSSPSPSPTTPTSNQIRSALSASINEEEEDELDDDQDEVVPERVVAVPFVSKIHSLLNSQITSSEVVPALESSSLDLEVGGSEGAAVEVDNLASRESSPASNKPPPTKKVRLTAVPEIGTATTYTLASQEFQLHDQLYHIQFQFQLKPLTSSNSQLQLSQVTFQSSLPSQILSLPLPLPPLAAPIQALPLVVYVKRKPVVDREDPPALAVLTIVRMMLKEATPAEIKIKAKEVGWRKYNKSNYNNKIRIWNMSKLSTIPFESIPSKDDGNIVTWREFKKLFSGYFLKGKVDFSLIPWSFC